MYKPHRKPWPKSKTSDISKQSRSPLHHTFLLGRARFTAQPLSALVRIEWTSSIYRKTTAEAWNWHQRWLWSNGTRMSVWNIPSRKTELTFQVLRCSRKFSAGTTKWVMLHLLSNRILRIFCFVNGKQRIITPAYMMYEMPMTYANSVK